MACPPPSPNPPFASVRLVRVTPDLDAALVAAIRECVLDYLREIALTYDHDGLDHDVADLVGYYARDRHGFWALVATDASDVAPRVLGTIGMRALDADWAELKRMYVRPDARGHGYARYLAEVVLDAARDAGYIGVRLDTRRDMLPARTLYAQLGFVETGDYNANPRASCFMERRV